MRLDALIEILKTQPGEIDVKCIHETRMGLIFNAYPVDDDHVKLIGEPRTVKREEYECKLRSSSVTGAVNEKTAGDPLQ